MNATEVGRETRRREGKRRSPVLALAAFALLAPSLLLAKDTTSKAFSEQLAFGTQMAQRGLWSEALFRFRQAEKLEPGNVRAMNNVAVALEAIGKFDEALAAYQQALKADPGNVELKRNYGRFSEFYQSFKNKPKTEPTLMPAKPPGAP
jgi:Flp pilus assembly protein TadD